jgi:hypothetical protein
MILLWHEEILILTVKLSIQNLLGSSVVDRGFLFCKNGLFTEILNQSLKCKIQRSFPAKLYIGTLYDTVDGPSK